MDWRVCVGGGGGGWGWRPELGGGGGGQEEGYEDSVTGTGPGAGWPFWKVAGLIMMAISEVRSVKEVVDLAFPSLIVPTVSVDVKTNGFPEKSLW